MLSKQALVFGASGISGWAIARECLTYPTTDTLDRVIGLTLRALKKDDLLLTEGRLDRIDIYSEIDLSQDAEVVIKKFKEIEGVERTTHVFFAGKSPCAV